MTEEPNSKMSLSMKIFTFFAVVGIIGLGSCGLNLVSKNMGPADIIGFGLIILSLVGLVITAVCMAIASILKATEKK